jgi:(1->4)-alpha-D-glucan 1-alpha-D-glucosylmutase
MTNISFPSATYRLQLNKDFTFAHAEALVPYLAELGASHAYLSPILMAQPGSSHGYDTVDHSRINPELGTLDDFSRLAKTLRQAGLGILLDFVPNHMGVGGASNAQWLDLLRHGRESEYANFFDVDWDAPGANGKILVPFLGLTAAEGIAQGQIRLKADDGDLAVWAHDTHKLPLRPQDQEKLLREHGSPEQAAEAMTGDALAQLIERQHWRVAHYLAAADEINYRRFFINSELGGIRIERPEVFDHAHQLIFQLIEEGLVEGLRIDHIDGLRDPKAYVEELVAKSPRPIYLLVEKILAPDETIRSDWPVHGTTGYEFGAMLTRVLTNPDGEMPLSQTYARFTGNITSPQEEAYRCKLRVMDRELAAELATLSRRVAGLAQSVPATRDLTENTLRRALREIIGWMSVYRTYMGDGARDACDRAELTRAIADARKAEPSIWPMAFDFLGQLLLGELGEAYDGSQIGEIIARFQQYTGPVMAKGLEDTALYRHNRMVALNEVGAHPEQFHVGIADFHAANQCRLADEPYAMLATSTHDTKRGEDTRARIAAIAERPDVWTAAVDRWRNLLLPSADTIDSNDLYLFFQLLLGGWPADNEGMLPQDRRQQMIERLQAAMMKSVREARVHSDWTVQNPDYEDALNRFIAEALGSTAFLEDFRQVEAELAPIGWRLGLAQTILKLTVPGVPDIYRGAEDWEQSFVDPDNRRPVNFSALEQRLGKLRDGAEGNRFDAKLDVTRRLLSLRNQAPDLFLKGSYEPLVLGEGILAFRRQHGGETLLVAVSLDRSAPDWPLPPLDLPGHARDVLANSSLERGGIAVYHWS